MSASIPVSKVNEWVTELRMTADDMVLSLTPPAPAVAKITVNSVNQNNQPVVGYYITFTDGSGAVKNGFTPASFETPTGKSCKVSVADYGDAKFSRWSDGGTTRERSFTPSADRILTAVYQVGVAPAPAPPPPSGSAKAGTMVPLYTYPNHSSWNSIIAAKQANPSVPIIAVVNPASGVGQVKDSQYTAGIKKLKTAGIKVLGYISTTYGKRAASAIKSEIDTWYSRYPDIEGIFFDEQPNWGGWENHYKSLTTHVKSKRATAITVGNPGADSIPSYLSTVDIVIVYESPGLPSLSSYQAKWGSYDNWKLGMIPFGVSTLPTDWVRQCAGFVGWIYVQSDVLSNPWDSIPSYFRQLVDLLASV